ncbi:MAG: HPP family protein [Acidobacteria bacterium]|nr:HPP family protein [Acidobacteriota bacterium]
MPQGHAGADHIFSFFRKLRLDWLLLHFPPRLVRSVYVFVNGFITIGVLALLALVSRNPFVFPSLGPTAYLLFFTPLGRTSSPRKYCFGSCYWSHMLLCGIRCHGCRRTAIRSPSGNFLAKNPGSGSFLSVTGAFMVLLDVSHPPAGATTLIVSLGIISKPRELVIIEVAVFLLVAQALMINRLAGLLYPFWSPPPQTEQ